MWRLSYARCHDHNRRTDRVSVCIRAPSPAVAPNARNPGIENRLDIKMRGVTFQIFDDLFARWIGRIGPGHFQAGQTGTLAIRVKVKAIVMTPPDRTDTIRLLKQSRVEPCRAHGHGAGESRRASADNDGVGISGHAHSRCPERAPQAAPSPRAQARRAKKLYFPHTSFATSTVSFSLAHCSSSVRTLPSSVEAKPHCGDTAS